MTDIQVKGLQVLSIFVSNIVISEDFYTSVLGFERKGELPPGITLASGDLMIYLEPGRISRTKPAGSEAEICPCFDVDSVRSAWETVLSHNTSVIEKYTEYSPEFAMFKIADPDGNILEFAGTP